jgi:hypothetical protein
MTTRLPDPEQKGSLPGLQKNSSPSKSCEKFRKDLGLAVMVERCEKK